MNETVKDVVTMLGAALLGSIPGILAFIGGLKRNKIDSVNVITDAATALVEPLRTEIAELREIIYDLKLENELLRAWAKALTIQVVELGGTPAPEPVIPPKKSKIRRERKNEIS